LRSPEKSELVEESVRIRFLQPGEGLEEASFGIVVIAEGQGGALSPDAGKIFVRERSEFLVSAGCAVMQVASERSEFFLRGGVFRSGGVERRRGSIGLATGAARGRFGMSGFFLFVGGFLGEKSGVAAEGED